MSGEGKAHTKNSQATLDGQVKRATENSFHRGERMKKHLAPAEGQDTRDRLGRSKHRGD
jgi:hypothetical protein